MFIFYKTKSKNSGFTIIEMMIAIALFLVIIIYGMQALLNANFVHKKSQNMRSVLDGLTFALEDMSKNIRVGSNYFCITNDVDFYNITDQKPQSCKDGFGIAFESSKGDTTSGTDQWAYFIGDNKLFRSTGQTYNQGIDDVQMTPDNLEIDMNASGFSVIGAESELNGNKQQPFVIIRLAGKIKGNNNTSTDFSIETAVSQRLIDIGSSSNDIGNILVPNGPSPLGPQDITVIGQQSAQQLSQSILQEAQSSEAINKLNQVNNVGE